MAELEQVCRGRSAPARSAIPTNGTPETCGVSAITTGTLRSSAAATLGWSSGSEKMKQASTSAASHGARRSARRRSSTTRQQDERDRRALGLGARPPSVATAAGSSNAYESPSVNSTPIEPERPERRARPAGSGPA